MGARGVDSASLMVWDGGSNEKQKRAAPQPSARPPLEQTALSRPVPTHLTPPEPRLRAAAATARRAHCVCQGRAGDC